MIDYSIKIGEEEKEILLDLTVQDKTYLKRQHSIQILGGVLAVCIFLMGLSGHNIVYEIGGVVVLLLAIFAVGPIQKQAVQKAYTKVDPRVVSGERHYIIDSSGIKISSKMGVAENRWNAFIAHGEYGHYVWIQRADRQMLLIDKRKLSEDGLLELKGYVNRI